MTDQPLHDFIDMEAYDVVAGQTYRDLLAAHERVKAEKDEAFCVRDITEYGKLEARLDRALSALREIDRVAVPGISGPVVGRIARAAIAEIEGVQT